MELAVGRLMDKSINAVKSAIQLLAAFIAHNPYSCKVTRITQTLFLAQIRVCSDFSLTQYIFSPQLSSADLKKPLEKETAKLREIKEKLKAKAPGKQTLILLQIHLGVFVKADTHFAQWWDQGEYELSDWESFLPLTGR